MNSIAGTDCGCPVAKPLKGEGGMGGDTLEVGVCALDGVAVGSVALNGEVAWAISLDGVEDVIVSLGGEAVGGLS